MSASTERASEPVNANPAPRPPGPRSLAGVSLAAAAAAALACAGARADTVLFDNDGMTLRFGANAAAALLHEPNACYAADGDSECVAADVSWLDGFVKVKLAGDYDMGAAGRLFAEADAHAGIVAFGDGDPYGIGEDGREIASDVHHIGWASGDAIPGLATDALKITVGNQKFAVGDGFVIADGVSDYNRGVAFYSAPMRAFHDSVTARLDAGPVRGAVFLLDSTEARGRAEQRVAGLDLEFVNDTLGTVGAAVMKVLDDNRRVGTGPGDLGPSIEGMHVASVRAQGNPLADAGWTSLFASGEYVTQWSGNAGKIIDAKAWYGEAGYTFEDVPWKPYFGYRRSIFSGDDPATTDLDEGYNFLYPAFTRGWGTWFQGEVFTNYIWHSDLRVHMLQARFAPADDLAVTANLYDIDFDVAPPGADGNRNGALEFNAMVDWTINANMGLTPIFGISFPDEGLSNRTDRSFGDDTAYLFGLYAWASY